MITEDHEEIINEQSLSIRCIPFWKRAQIPCDIK